MEDGRAEQQMPIRLTDPKEDRYQRLRLMRWWDQERLGNARVLVAGAGALGNEVVKNLALLGAGRIWIADFDTIETTNLTRSVLFRRDDVGRSKAEILSGRAGEINPDCDVHALPADVRFDLGLNFLRGMDLIFGCLDNREARYYLNRYCYLLGKIFIDGGMDSLNGSVTVFRPPATPCYECTLTATDRAELQKRISCLKSPEAEILQHVPTAPTIGSIIGGLQVQIGVKHLHGLQTPDGKRLGLYGLSDLFFEIALEKSTECGLHAFVDPLPDRIETVQASVDDPVAAILELARKLWGASELSWDFDRDLFVSLVCTSCSRTVDFVGTQSRFQGAEQCECGGMFKPRIATGYQGTETWGSRSFRELGFPANHIYSAVTAGGRTYFAL
jgi:molybdopterin/thiamine biosynthesis adenylyltransferase